MSEVYANILEALTSGLYNEPKYALREYLQNAYDAITQAKIEKLPQFDEYAIKIEITKNNKIITITDNGVGMGKALLEEYTSIGGGTKNSPVFTGNKGIGKLSGLRFFHNFRVRTKTSGSSKAYELDWKCGEMISVVMNQKNKMKVTPYKNFIEDYYSIKEIDEEDANSHFTQVQLIDVTDEFHDRVSEEILGNFIKQNCPVPFNGDQFQHAERINKWLEINSDAVNTFINDKVIYQFYNNSDNLVEPILVEIKYDDSIKAKAWISWISDSSGTIENDEIQGIRFRCKGFCIGDSNLFANNCMPPGREFAASWFTGEIVVLAENIIPSAARDKFSEGADIVKFFSELQRKLGKQLVLIAETRSTIKNSEDDLIKINKYINEGQIVPLSLWKHANNNLKELQKCKIKDKYNFDFGVIERLQNLVKSEEEKELNKTSPVIVNPGEPLCSKPIEAIEKLLELKEEQDNSFFPKIKAKKQEQIDQIKNYLVNTSDKSQEDESQEENIYIFTNIIIKYLESIHISYDKTKVVEFIRNEIRRR